MLIAKEHNFKMTGHNYEDSWYLYAVVNSE